MWTQAFPHPMARILYRGFFADHVGQAKRASYFQSVEDARIMAEQAWYSPTLPVDNAISIGSAGAPSAPCF